MIGNDTRAEKPATYQKMRIILIQTKRILKEKEDIKNICEIHYCLFDRCFDRWFLSLQDGIS